VARTFLLTILLSTLLRAVPQTPGPPPPPPPPVQEQEPPEEDEALKPRDYILNPLQATREITVGNYYFKKGDFRAASGRYLEATRWDPGSAEAFLKLAEARERMHNVTGARDAYKKFLDVNKDAKLTIDVTKRLEKLPAK
jgi:tetratricopeptide (TPR) repeat protein